MLHKDAKPTNIINSRIYGLHAPLLSAIPPSDLEKDEAQFYYKQLENERKEVIRGTEDIRRKFDVALSKLRQDKFELEADVKYGEMCRLVMFHELQLLHDFQKREVILNAKLQERVADKGMVRTNLILRAFPASSSH